jgi:type II secretory pathway pseudopilin PulG
LSLARHRRAFSLIEVIIAVGVFALSVVVILAMLPSLSRSATDSADALVAQSLADSVRVELTRLATNGGFDALANRLPEMSAPLADGLDFVAARDDRRLHSVDYLPPPAAGQLPEAARYFRVEAWRFNQPPLRYDPASAVLAVYVRVSWPYQIPGAAAATPLSARSQLTFVVSLSR